MPRKSYAAPISFIFAVLLFITAPNNSSGTAVDELQRSIAEKNAEIQELEEEANKYRQEIAAKQEIGNTLSAEIKRIDGLIGRLRRDITVSEQKISRNQLEIESLAIEIEEKETSEKKLKQSLASLIQSFREQEEETLLEVLIKNRVLSEFFRQLDYVSRLKEIIIGALTDLREVRRELGIKKADAEEKKNELEDFQGALYGRRKIQEDTRRERDELLRLTKNQEKQYQKLLREQERKRAALEAEVREIEEQIRVTIDPSTLPPKGRGVLGWPLPDISLKSCWKGGEDSKNCLTQYFGYTSFAAVGGYAGKGHNGTDFRADIGTPVLSAERGVVEAAGDTDLGCRGASYGKWILIRHSNNLSTLYAHLSSVSAAQGQAVARQDRIGFSGKSGYATGPHLHFGVFASEAVKIESIRSKVCGRLMTLPIAATNGYLNPLDYL